VRVGADLVARLVRGPTVPSDIPR